MDLGSGRIRRVGELRAAYVRCVGVWTSADTTRVQELDARMRRRTGELRGGAYRLVEVQRAARERQVA